MSLRDNDINLLSGMSFVDLSKMKLIVQKIGQKYFSFWRIKQNSVKKHQQLWSSTTFIAILTNKSKNKYNITKFIVVTILGLVSFKE